jgi:energy-coupling factor transporter ATP-binding protein EcfA2
MILKALKFCRFKGEKGEWSIEGKPHDNEFGQYLNLENINLIVGKNATGKSRTIDVIRHIADLMSGDVKLVQLNEIGFGTANYVLVFDVDGIDYCYSLDFRDGKVMQETLRIGDIEKLNRKAGKLWYEGESKLLDSETADDILTVTKRDKKQHPFFELLFEWGKNLNHYRFGSQLGKNNLLKDAVLIKENIDIDLKDGNEVAKILLRGKKDFPIVFLLEIISDMKKISYNIDEIKTAPIKYYPISAIGINIKEIDLEDVTDQREMSQGMFRALSLLIQLNYALLSKYPSCILIDDIGEGLDYDRAKSLIDLIIEKVKKSNVQIIMTTNDRFVMNKVPLEYWSLIQRVPKKSLFFNYQNSKETFEEFKYTGLNNFDFLSTEFYITGFENQTEG